MILEHNCYCPLLHRIVLDRDTATFRHLFLCCSFVYGRDRTTARHPCNCLQNKGKDSDRGIFSACRLRCASVLQIVVAHDQIYLAIQTFEYLCPFSCAAQAEIAQVENGIIFTYHAVPICYHHLVHLLYVFERTIAKPDNVRMIEVRI